MHENAENSSESVRMVIDTIEMLTSVTPGASCEVSFPPFEAPVAIVRFPCATFLLTSEPESVPSSVGLMAILGMIDLVLDVHEDNAITHLLEFVDHTAREHADAVPASHEHEETT